MTDKPEVIIIPEHSDPPDVWNRYPTFSGKLAFDIGANGGVIANILAERFDRVVAFEPHTESYAYLDQHAKPNVVTLEMAVSNRSGEIHLDQSVNADVNGMLTTGESLRCAWGDRTGQLAVTAITIDDLVKLYGTPDFVKIDTEGHEGEVVKGGFNFFTHHKPQVVIEIHSAEAGERVRSLLWDYEFERIDHPMHKI